VPKKLNKLMTTESSSIPALKLFVVTDAVVGPIVVED